MLGQFYPAERARLEALAIEAGESRLYGGIHYRFDADAGFAIARAVAAIVAQREELAQGEGAPAVAQRGAAAPTAGQSEVRWLSRSAP